MWNQEVNEAVLKFWIWFRANLIVLIFGTMLFLQMMIWYSIAQLRRDLPNCSFYQPCTIELTKDSADAIARALSKSR